jgi:hypothetical protein
MNGSRTYKSKIGLELVIPIAIVLGGTSILFIIENAWAGLLINLSVIAFIWYTFNTTIYIIKDNQLFVRCGFFVNEPIKIESIKKITETRNMISSAAASLDRLEILFDKFGSVLVSPKEKMSFIDQLKEINPGIEIKFKEK